MKKHMVVAVLSVVLAALVFAADARAVGIGGYLEAGGGSGRLEIKPDNAPNLNYETDMDVSHGGLGFLIDTAPINEHWFNYRLNIGLESITFKPNTGSDIKASGIAMIHDIGFAIVRNPKMRIWAGPEVKFGYYNGKRDSDDRDVHFSAFGIGPVAGINFRMSRMLVLAFKGGILYSGYSGRGDDPNLNYDIKASSTEVLVNAAIIWDLNAPKGTPKPKPAPAPAPAAPPATK